MTAVRAGLLYVALIFALGFLLGTIRTLWLLPAVGEAHAILLEVPVMLLASLLTARWLVQRLKVPACLPDRLLMGGTALLMLLGAELLLARLLSGDGPGEALAAMTAPARLPGLVAQLLFGLFPALQLLRPQRRWLHPGFRHNPPPRDVIMTEDPILARLFDLIEPFNRKGVPLGADTHFANDLELDSLTVMDLVANIEDEWDINMPLNMLPDLETVGQVADAVRTLKG